MEKQAKGASMVKKIKKCDMCTQWNAKQEMLSFAAI
jgi:hypothetical protein